MDTARIILGVTGGIAAFKSLNVLRQLKKLGHEVIVIPTENALKMVGKTSFESLSGHSVSSNIFEHEKGYGHIELSNWADLFIICPTTANFISKMAIGSVDDLLSATLIATKKPILIAPAMHTNMYEHPATQNNLKILSERGIHIIGPAIGELTNGDIGKGRLVDEELIVETALGLIVKKDLLGKKILITAGGTKEYIDQVRCITNSSSGKQGIALATQSKKRGAEVTVVSCNINKELLPKNIEIKHVVTAQQLYSEVIEHYEKYDVIIMCAAVSDWTVKNPSKIKLKKDKNIEEINLSLVKTKDILKTLCQKNIERKKLIEKETIENKKIIVGFAAETGDQKQIIEYAKQKIVNKQCDFLVLNPVGKNKAFGKDTNHIYIINKQGEILFEEKGSKIYLADKILDTILTKNN